ncbi:hypothetical protein GQ53DRAFT_773703 [Thozetella sp. PMI_491]|nr:hypothetical protein GQ53DRAFT_773703 [Thozetella sp. PMI_491]
MKIFAALFALVAITNATPAGIIERDPGTLEKRDTEIVYLANCVSAVSCCTPNVYYSQIIYYPASAQSQNGEVPSSSNRCTTSSSSYTTWEGSAHPCTFSTGATFTSHIDSGSHAAYSYSGWGYNGKTWNCYRDNGRVLFDPYMPEASNSCSSVYYCLPA